MNPSTVQAPFPGTNNCIALLHLIYAFNCCLQRCINCQKTKLCKNKPAIIQGMEIKLLYTYSDRGDSSIWFLNVSKWCLEALGNLCSNLTVPNTWIWPSRGLQGDLQQYCQPDITRKQNQLLNSCSSRPDYRLCKLQNYLENVGVPMQLQQAE